MGVNVNYTLVNGILTISGVIEHTDIYVADWPWFNDRDTITSVVFESGTSFAINSNACGMFNNCSSLTSLNLTNLDTSNVTNMSYMFFYCSSLTSLDLSNFNTSNVTDMSSMFRYCRSLKSLDLTSFDTSNVTNMSYMFYNCRSLESLDLTSFNTSNVTDMSYMFYYCSSLTPETSYFLDLSSFDMTNVTNTSSMFYSCTWLKTNLYVTSIPSTYTYMFHGVYSDTFIINKNNDSSIEEFWQGIADSDDSSIYYESSISTFTTTIQDASRGTATTVESDESGEVTWEDDDDGNSIRIVINPTYTLVTNYIPYNWNITNIVWKIYKDGVATTLPSNTYSYIYENVDTNRHSFTATATITYTDSNLTSITREIESTCTATEIVLGPFALVDFRAGGYGMAIGKVATRNGLDIAFPTMIGEGLIPAMDQGDSSEIDLTNYQLVVGQYNEEESDAYIIVGDGTSEERKNIFEVRKDGYIKVGDGLMGVSTGIKEFTVWCYQASTEHPDPTPQLQLKRKDNIDTEASLTSFMLNIGRTNLHLQEAPSWTTLWNVDMTKIAKLSNKTRTTFNPISGSSWANYGGCYYEVYGQFVHVHLGIGSLTANTNTAVYTLPSSIQPDTMIFGTGIGNNISTMSRAHISTSGVITVNSAATYCGIELYYLI